MFGGKSLAIAGFSISKPAAQFQFQKEEENAAAMNSSKLNVDVSKLRRGNYLLKFQIGGKLVTKSFTIE